MGESVIAMVHSNSIERDADTDHLKPNKEYEARLSTGLTLLNSKRVNTIILTGGKATKGIDRKHGDVGKGWLVSRGVTPEVIHTERDTHGSLESVGEMVFARQDHGDLLLQSQKLIVISSNYHMGRLWEIGSSVLGENIRQKIEMIGVPIDTPRSLEQEQSSLNAFRTTFAGIPIGDMDVIMNRLWKKHPLYKNHPSNPYKEDGL